MVQAYATFFQGEEEYNQLVQELEESFRVRVYACQCDNSFFPQSSRETFARSLAEDELEGMIRKYEA